MTYSNLNHKWKQQTMEYKFKNVLAPLWNCSLFLWRVTWEFLKHFANCSRRASHHYSFLATKQQLSLGVENGLIWLFSSTILKSIAKKRSKQPSGTNSRVFCLTLNIIFMIKLSLFFCSRDNNFSIHQYFKNLDIKVQVF